MASNEEVAIKRELESKKAKRPRALRRIVSVGENHMMIDAEGSAIDREPETGLRTDFVQQLPRTQLLTASSAGLDGSHAKRELDKASHRYVFAYVLE